MKKIGIISNTTKDVGLENTKRIIDILADKASLYMDIQYKGYDDRVNYIKYESLFETVKYMIVIGGDGTILQIAADCARKDIAVLGINMGKVGFMTEIETENMDEALLRLIDDDFDIEQRMLLRVEKRCGKSIVLHNHALNDVVVSKSAGAKLISIELYTNGELVNRYNADGLIIATPTGSTGYSISAGGPVIDPAMQLYVATPICPHMLSVRSAVLSADKELIIRLDDKYLNNNAVISTDGDVQGDLTAGEELRITKSKYELKMIKIGSYSFYDTVLRKLS
ncbi:MAG: NAD(+)/NADH kinase [Clostridiales bacterium]|nr:NAD(+)/NADH kinase [Clostridiales bacterium]